MNPLIACRLIMIFATYFPDIGKVLGGDLYLYTYHSEICQFVCHV